MLLNETRWCDWRRVQLNSGLVIVYISVLRVLARVLKTQVDLFFDLIFIELLTGLSVGALGFRASSDDPLIVSVSYRT